MDNVNFQDDLNWLLIKASMAAKHDLMKASEAHDLSVMQGLTICLLQPGKPVPMSAISEWLTCDPSNVTGIVERLSVGSYIDRRESHADRRVKTIELTKSGIALRNKLLPQILENESSNLARLTTKELETLKLLLLKTLPNCAKPQAN